MRIALLLLFPAGLLAQPSAGGDTPAEWSYPCHCEWRKVDTAGTPTARHENAFVRTGDRFFLLGGRGNKPVDIYDPATGQWSEGASPPIEIHHFQPVVFEEKIYVVGGMTGGFPREDPLDRVLIYDPSADEWSWGATIPEARRRGAAGAVLHDGLIYLVSGIVDGHWDGHVTWFDAFDPQTGTWTVLLDAPRARDHFQASVIDGKIYAAGGRRSSRHEDVAGTWRHLVPEVDVYDLAAGEWSTLPSPSLDLPTPRAGTATVAHGDHLIVIGGETWEDSDAHDTVEAFDTGRQSWNSMPRLSVPRHGTGALVHENILYIAAGNRTRGGGAEADSMERLALGPADELTVREGDLWRPLAVDLRSEARSPTVAFGFQHRPDENAVRSLEGSHDLRAWTVKWTSDDPEDLDAATRSTDAFGTRTLEVELALPSEESSFFRLRSNP